MATVTSFIDGTIGEKHVATVGVTNKKFYTENTIDLSLLNSGSADVIQCLNIPKGAFVTNVGVYKLTIEDSTLTGDLGDATDADDAGTDGSGAEDSLASGRATTGHSRRRRSGLSPRL